MKAHLGWRGSGAGVGAAPLSSQSFVTPVYAKGYGANLLRIGRLTAVHSGAIRNAVTAPISSSARVAGAAVLVAE